VAFGRLNGKIGLLYCNDSEVGVKDKFPGYYKPTNEEFDAIWDEAIVIVDANVLLNLYTYSESTSEELLNLLHELTERLWLPHQVAKEYHENRCGIIAKEANRYGEISKELDRIVSALRARKRHPFVEIDLLEKFEKIANEIKYALKHGEDNHKDLIGTDAICEKITNIFEGRVGDPMPKEELEKLYKDGAERFKKRIPPGYGDEKKPEPSRYGDLVLWVQLMEHASSVNKPIIFVTDDSKEDWWALVGDRRIGPRPELRHEFRSETGKDFYIYSTELFVETVKNRGKKISEAAVEEIEDASKQRVQNTADMRMLERLTRDPLAQFRKQQEALERLTRDPLAQFREQQEALERLMRDPLAQFREQHEALERLKDFEKEPECSDDGGTDEEENLDDDSGDHDDRDD
jgi:hypothetical protein